MNRLSPFFQNALYAGILLITGLIFYVIRPIPDLSPRGIFLPTDQESDQHPRSVSLFEAIPEDARVLGHISIFAHFDTTDSATIESLLLNETELAKDLAAKKGASKMVIDMAGRTPGEPSALDSVMINATAIE